MITFFARHKSRTVPDSTCWQILRHGVIHELLPATSIRVGDICICIVPDNDGVHELVPITKIVVQQELVSP